MFKILFSLLALLPMADQKWSLPDTSCDCPSVTNLQRTGQTATSYTLSWDGHTGADSYAVSYIREEGGYTSSVYSTTSSSYTFESLPNGHYTFYVTALCGTESSGFVGIEDFIEN